MGEGREWTEHTRGSGLRRLGAFLPLLPYLNPPELAALWVPFVIS